MARVSLPGVVLVIMWPYDSIIGQGWTPGFMYGCKFLLCYPWNLDGRDRTNNKKSHVTHLDFTSNHIVWPHTSTCCDSKKEPRFISAFLWLRSLRGHQPIYIVSFVSYAREISFILHNILWILTVTSISWVHSSFHMCVCLSHVSVIVFVSLEGP